MLKRQNSVHQKGINQPGNKMVYPVKLYMHTLKLTDTITSCYQFGNLPTNTTSLKTVSNGVCIWQCVVFTHLISMVSGSLLIYMHCKEILLQKCISSKLSYGVDYN